MRPGRSRSQAAAHEVEHQQWVEYGLLDQLDLLILVPVPPEPPAEALVRHLRRRSTVPTLALVTNCSDTQRDAVLKAGADDCLDAAVSDAQLLAHVEELLSSRSRVLLGTRVDDPAT